MLIKGLAYTLEKKGFAAGLRQTWSDSPAEQAKKEADAVSLVVNEKLLYEDTEAMVNVLEGKAELAGVRAHYSD